MEIYIFSSLFSVIMVRKKIDNRIRTLIENGVTAGHRTMFVIVGDKGRDQVLNRILYILYCICIYMIVLINCNCKIYVHYK